MWVRTISVVGGLLFAVAYLYATFNGYFFNTG